ncbi:DUF6192 family protein [Streptomyces sp. SDr-06]|uniref:DUF6192 family protein n=1 Tax=Streptomyces sp. SDr-06 TaxID=2267702 RepID=UPI001CB9CA87|nr:DUF6192 family protein [Streptomyces sp. SDr-06]
MVRGRFEELVARSLDSVEMDARCQFAIGDAALEIEPMRPHGGRYPVDGDGLGVQESLRLFAESIGLSYYTVRTQRWVAAQWPVEFRQAGASYEIHRILGHLENRFEVIKDPPLNERTGKRQWCVDAAKRMVGWKTDTPVTLEERVEAIQEIAGGDEAVATAVATAFLRRPEVAFKAMRDPLARERVNEAQFEQAELLEEDEFEEDYDEAFGDYAGEDEQVDPARIVRGFHRAMEFSDLIAVCQGFIAGATRLVPKLRGWDFTEAQSTTVERQLEKIRATADWIESAVATGKVDLDEQLAELLRGQ